MMQTNKMWWNQPTYCQLLFVAALTVVYSKYNIDIRFHILEPGCAYIPVLQPIRKVRGVLEKSKKLTG